MKIFSGTGKGWVNCLFYKSVLWKPRKYALKFVGSQGRLEGMCKSEWSSEWMCVLEWTQPCQLLKPQFHEKLAKTSPGSGSEGEHNFPLVHLWLLTVSQLWLLTNTWAVCAKTSKCCSPPPMVSTWDCLPSEPSYPDYLPLPLCVSIKQPALWVLPELVWLH